MSAFSQLPLAPALLSNLATLGYQGMTPIQAAALPHALAGQDLLARAPTGSGKTTAFALPMLHHLNPTLFAVQAMVLCPTRELADQVAQETRRLARALGNIKVLVLSGGAPMRPQVASLEHGAHIVVGTPGRLRDHLERRTLDLRRLRVLVLDEADRMTDMGFYDDMQAIAQACPVHRQTLLFSATYPDDIRQVAATLMRDPVEVTVDADDAPPPIDERFYALPERADMQARADAVQRLLLHFRPESTLVFCNTRLQCAELAGLLAALGWSAAVLHGDMEQRDRDEVLLRFANRSLSVLVASDVAARGIDIGGLDAVINAELSRDAQVHVHRIGRTGRAGQDGLALTLVAPHEARRVRALEAQRGAPLELRPLDELPAPDADQQAPMCAPMVTLCIQGGKRDKLRPGDILGALTGDGGLTREQVGKINVIEFASYVALARDIAEATLAALCASGRPDQAMGNIKGRLFRMRLMRETFADIPANPFSDSEGPAGE